MIARGHLPQMGELIAFDASARHQSFTRAASELNLSQGAVSKAIQSLELRLGRPLFDRVRQRVLLTSAGRDYLMRIAPLLRELGEATERARADGPDVTVLNIAVLPTLGMRWLLPKLPDFLAAEPRTTVNFVTRLRPFDLALEGIDVAVHHGAPVWPGAMTHHLMDEQMVPMVSSAYRRRLGLNRPVDLARATLLHQSTRPAAWARWAEAAGLAAFAVQDGPTFDQFGMAVEAAAADMGVALVPRFLAEQEVGDGKLEVLFDLPLQSGSAYYLAVPQGRTKRIAQAFTTWLVGIVKRGPIAN